MERRIKLKNRKDDYIKFEPSKDPIYGESDEDKFYLFNDNKLLVRVENDKYFIPKKSFLKKEAIDVDYIQSLGAYRGVNCFSGELCKPPKDERYKLVDLRQYSRLASKEEFYLSAKAKILHNYIKKNRKCGVCGFAMEDKMDEDKARYCPNCYNTVWPQTSPAIIVAVTKGDKLLLAHNTLFPKGMYSVIAGFVEMGETFEDCVRREVFEETGIKVHNIKYFGSQPWPFPNSMMIGFTAEYLEGEINVDQVEIEHADWFTKEEIPGKYRKSKSISSELIGWFLDR